MSKPRPPITTLTMVRRHNIMRVMNDGGWDRRAFSKLTGVKYATLSAYLGENVKGNIGDKTLGVIAEATGKSPEWFDKDRRNGDSTTADKSVTTITMKSGTLSLVDHPINNFQRDAIISLLFND